MPNRLTNAIGELGWLDGPLYLVSRALALISADRWRVFKYYYVAQPVEDQAISTGGAIAIQVLTPDCASVLPREQSVLRQRYAQGARCLAAWLDGQLLGFIWYTVAPYREDEVRAIFIPHGSAWDFDVEVLPKYRMGRAFATLWQAAGKELRNAGIEWTCSRISAFNRASQNAHLRLGARNLGSAIFLCCGKWQWMFSACEPYFHLSRHEGSVPMIFLDPRGMDK